MLVAYPLIDISYPICINREQSHILKKVEIVLIIEF